jgi:4-aminobutyrate--pyruvate transaminase
MSKPSCTLPPIWRVTARRVPLVLERGEGVYVYDSAGKRYIEGLAGLWCTGSATATPSWSRTAREQMARLSFSHLFGGRSHEPAIALAEKIKAIVPGPTSKVFLTNSGSEANDTQIKIAWYYNNAIGRPKKKKIISRQRAYHGTTIASASLSGLSVFHADFDLPMARVLHTDCPHYGKYAESGETEDEYATRLAKNLETMIEQEGPDTIAAFIAEPVMGAGGVLIPPKTYFAKVQALLAQHDIAFIADEVICGFARTGNWWGSETFGITPTTVTMAKAITSAYVPLGAITVSEEMYGALVEASGKHGVLAHGFTYSGHPLACAVALKTIEIYERMNIVATCSGWRRSSAAAEGAGRSPAGRRGARRRPDRRAGADARQACQAGLRREARRRHQGDALCRGGGVDLPGRRRRQRRALPAADHRRRRDQRHVRRAGPRAGQDGDVGTQGRASRMRLSSRNAHERVSGTQSLWMHVRPWVPDISLTRNSGMNTIYFARCETFFTTV